MEQLLDQLVYLSPILSLLELLGVVFSILYMYYTAKYRNHSLSVGWYICAVFFGVITLIVFLVKKKEFPSPDSKVCASCGDQLPESFQVCPRCMMDLPPVDEAAKAKNKKCSKVFGIVTAIFFTISTILSIVVGVLTGIATAEELEYLLDDDFSYYDDYSSYRIAVDGLFYDQQGNSYEFEDDVLLYDEQGRTYSYTEEEFYDVSHDYYHYEEYYVRDDGEKYFAADCYVDENGWFYCDKGGLLELYSVDTSTMTEEELDDYYDALLDAENEPYKYYLYPYVDADGKFYYCAYEASWNEKGELITAENDGIVENESASDYQSL